MALGRHELTRVLPPSEFRKKPQPPPIEELTVEFPQRLALFLIAMHRARTPELLQGLGGPLRKQAAAYAKEAARWDSPTRQARVTHEFGVRQDATRRLKELMHRASPPLRMAIYDRLPEWAQSLFPKLQKHAAGSASPAMLALAERLVRETTR